MAANKLDCGLLVTADPYSKIIDPKDKDTSLLFGDAGTATLIDKDPLLVSKSYTFGTKGSCHKDLICSDGKLEMNGRAIFEFAARYIPADILRFLEVNQLTLEDIDRYYLHQASRFMVETIAKKLNLSKDKCRFSATQCGNTVSSTIPIMLREDLQKVEVRRSLTCGFGVGLSWASGILYRV
jgi:3-oxoacyl-[acyl-carrier-protein] synthase-3